MAEFSVQKIIPMPLAKVRERLDKLLDEAGDLKKYDSTLVIDWNDQGAKFKGKVFNGDVRLTEENGETVVNIVVNLAFLLTPFKGKVKGTIEKEIDRIFSTTTT